MAIKTTRACRHEDALSNLPDHARTLTRSRILAAIGVGAHLAVDVPSQEAIVTFSVADERFRVWLTDREQIDAAGAAQRGSTVQIPNGRIVSGS
jgi:hypothetical protein